MVNIIQILITAFSFEGFYLLNLLQKALEKSGIDLTRKAFLEAFNKLDKNSLAGFEIKFSKIIMKHSMKFIF